jgi:hypothetical protein
MIHYHGGPLGKAPQSHEFFRGRHSLVSFQHRGELEIMAEVSHSFIFDNGSFSVWKSGKTLDVAGYYKWVDDWRRHPGFDWCLIPDVIEGSEADNDSMISDWPFGFDGVPVWHLNESLERLETLAESWPRIAFGSTSGIEPNSKSFWLRMAEVMDVVCDKKGRPICKLHGLRMLNPEIFKIVPLASADSCTCVMNAFMPGKQFGIYLPKRESQRANVIADRIESYNSPPSWDKSDFPIQEKLL